MTRHVRLGDNETRRRDGARRSAAARIACTLAGAALLGSYGGAANAVQLGDLIRITGPSPFANCTADDVPGQTDPANGIVNYPNSEIEPWVASDPRNPNRLLTGWQQDRWSDGGSRGLVAGVSTNGGATWRTVLPGRVTKCEGGPFTRASDPWVDFSPSGIGYFIHLAFEPDLPN